MDKRDLGAFRVEIDRERTLKWYALSNGWGCECVHCRNFLEIAKKRELPTQVLEILDQLEISPEKATYVGELYTDDSGIHYQFSYRLCGTFDDAESRSSEDFRCCHEPYPYGAPHFPEPHFDLEFYATLPWVLDEPQK